MDEMNFFSGAQHPDVIKFVRRLDNINSIHELNTILEGEGINVQASSFITCRTIPELIAEAKELAIPQMQSRIEKSTKKTYSFTTEGILSSFYVGQVTLVIDKDNVPWKVRLTGKEPLTLEKEVGDSWENIGPEEINYLLSEGRFADSWYFVGNKESILAQELASILNLEMWNFVEGSN
jgi:hypothetical protein